MGYMGIFISKKLNFLIIKKNKENCNDLVFIYNLNKYFCMPVYKLIVYKQTNVLVINNKSPERMYVDSSFLINYFYLWDLFFLKKIRFKGKGYKINKRKHIIFLKFNHSH